VDDAFAISELLSRPTRVCILPEQPKGAAAKLLGWMSADASACLTCRRRWKQK